jgi:hypothetical protein
VTQSSFADPCHPLSNGFFSSFVPTSSSPSGTTFTILINDTKPIWIYCGQTANSHCQSGMVAAINAPATGNTLEAFIAKAKNATASTSPPSSAPLGGILKVGSASNNSSSASVISTTKTVTATITTLVTANGNTYSTTYGTTYTTALPLTTIVPVSTSGTSSGAAATQTKSSSAGHVVVGGSVFGAAAAVAWALL